MRTFCTLVIVGGAEHAQTFNFWTATDSDDGFEWGKFAQGIFS